jgi:putative peptidoglycan lipid II flippase
VRVAVLSRTLGTSCVGDVYTVANAVPNVVFELVAGGALAALVVPVLAGPVAAGDRATASRTASALLTWTVAVLVPVALAGALAAPLLARALLGDAPACARAVEVGARMLVVLLPQVVLYGLAVVLAGVLQAHRRFLGPALAPLLSSLVVVAAYLLYAARGGAQDLTGLTRDQELVLSVGTTLGVAVLALSLLVPLRSCGLRLRPVWSFPPGVAARARALAAGGVAGLAAQQLALVVALRLAAGGQEGSVVVLTVATALFLLPVGGARRAGRDQRLPGAVGGGGARRRGGVRPRAARCRALGPARHGGLGGGPGRRRAGGAELLVQGARAPPAAPTSRRPAPPSRRAGRLRAARAARARLLRPRAGADGRRRHGPAWLAVAVADVALVAALPDADRVLLLGVGNTSASLSARPCWWPRCTGRPSPVRAGPPSPVCRAPPSRCSPAPWCPAPCRTRCPRCPRRSPSAPSPPRSS